MPFPSVVFHAPYRLRPYGATYSVICLAYLCYSGGAMSAYLEYFLINLSPLKFDLCFLISKYIIHYFLRSVKSFFYFFRFLTFYYLPLTIIIIPLFTVFAIDKMHKDFGKNLCNLYSKKHLTKMRRHGIMEFWRGLGCVRSAARQSKKSHLALFNSHSRSNPCKD